MAEGGDRSVDELVEQIKTMLSGLNSSSRRLVILALVSSELECTRRPIQYEDEIESNIRKKRGKVPILEYEVLQKHRVEMIQLLEPSKIMDHLYKNGVIDKDEVEKIEQKSKDLRRKGAETMFNIIYNSGSWAFQRLLEALNHAAYKDMAKKLKGDLEKKKKDPNSVSSTSKQRGAVSAIEFEVLRDNHERLVNELDSSVLKNHLFKNGLINEDELEEITKEEEKLRKKGAEEMMKIIYESGANAFPKLVKSLEEAGYKEMSLKLVSDLIQKKEEEENHNCQKMDLSLVTFPEFPHLPCQKYDDIQGDNFIEMWKENLNAEYLWFNPMSKWFNNHDFSSKEVLKLVVKDWLVTIEEVIERGCLERNVINFYIDITDRVKGDDYWRTIVRSMNENPYRLSDYTNEMSREDVIHTLEKDREMYREYHRDTFNKIKHNLEVIIGEKNGDIQSIDAGDIFKCKLARILNPVISDVRNISKKLP